MCLEQPFCRHLGFSAGSPPECVTLTFTRIDERYRDPVHNVAGHLLQAVAARWGMAVSTLPPTIRGLPIRLDVNAPSYAQFL